MTYRVDAAVDRMEAKVVDESIDRARREAQTEELKSRNSAVLTSGEVGYLAPSGVNPILTPHNDVNIGFTGHGPTVTATSAPVARET